MSERSVLLSTKEDAFAKKLKSFLDSRKTRTLVLRHVCKEISELRVYLEHTPNAFVIVDIDHNSSEKLKELDDIASSYPEAHFVVAASNSSEELILEAMRAGARYFILKNHIEMKLDEVIEHLLSVGFKKAYSPGSIISVFSAGGGCGATTVALNLANELRIVTGKTVLTVDLDHSYGAISSYLELSGSYSLIDVLNRGEQIDKNLVMSSAANYLKDFHVLTSPASDEHFLPPGFKYPNLIAFFEACRQAYKYTIIDAPRASEDVAKLLATISEVQLIVFQQTVKDIKIARSMISSLTRWGAKPERIIPLANKFRRFNPLVTLEDTKNVIGLGNICYIRNDFRRVVNCINHGELLAKSAPWSGVRREFQKLAAMIYTNGEKQQ
jgi:pilus assembly protein CpaE